MTIRPEHWPSGWTETKERKLAAKVAKEHLLKAQKLVAKHKRLVEIAEEAVSDAEQRLMDELLDLQSAEADLSAITLSEARRSAA